MALRLKGLRDGKRNSNLSKGPKTIDILFYKFRDMLQQLLCLDYKIPCCETTVALKLKTQNLGDDFFF